MARRKKEGDQPQRPGRPSRGRRGPAPEGGASPQERAQALVGQALEEAEPARRVALATEALALWPDCVDAHILLGEETPSPRHALPHYRQAVEAGERLLGPETLAGQAGQLWGRHEGRSHLNARLMVASCLWAVGQRGQAVAHLEETLRLNPVDNQGTRYLLAGWLAILDRNDELAALLDRYPEEESASWAWSRALLAFRREGDAPASRRHLQEAIRVNRHVTPYLLGDALPPADRPPFYTPGEDSEAVEYISVGLAAWRGTPGAVDWLRQAGRPTRGRRAGRGPRLQAATRRRLLALPQEPLTWQAHQQQVPMLVREGDQDVRPWLVLFFCEEEEAVVAPQVLTELTPQALLDALVQTCRSPGEYPPHRPTRLRVLHGSPWGELRAPVEEVGITLEEADQLEAVTFLLEQLRGQMDGETTGGLLQQPGVTPELAGAFFEAAAYFFEEAPWSRVGYEQALRIDCARWPGGPWYAVLMGQSGLTFGLALYDDLEQLAHLWSADRPDEETAAAEMTGLSVLYDEAHHTPLPDVEAIREHDWPVASAQAYPSIFRKGQGMSLEPPTPEELERMTACLLAIPRHVRKYPQDDTTPEDVTVTLPAGEVTLRLAWEAL